MGSLALHAQTMHKKNYVITEILVHFDSILVDGDQLKKVKTAADEAYTDELLFEKFESWMNDKNDEYLLFHISAFFEDQYLPSLASVDRDLTSKREKIEKSIEQKARDRQKEIVSERISLLARKRNLNTNEAIANFLDMDTEQVRRYIVGENKPQRATLIKIANKFDVSLEYLAGFKIS